MRKRNPFDQLAELELGVSNTDIELESSTDCAHATDLLVQQASSRIDLFTRDLDPAIYDREPFLTDLSSTCAQRQAIHVRVLIQSPVTPIKRGHRLIELSRRLSSIIEIRQPHSDYSHFNEAFLIVDQRGLVHRRFSDRFEGRANFNDIATAQRLTTFFNEVWEHSESSPETRRLHL